MFRMKFREHVKPVVNTTKSRTTSRNQFSQLLQSYSRHTHSVYESILNTSVSRIFYALSILTLLHTPIHKALPTTTPVLQSTPHTRFHHAQRTTKATQNKRQMDVGERLFPLAAYIACGLKSEERKKKLVGLSAVVGLIIRSVVVFFRLPAPRWMCCTRNVRCRFPQPYLQ